MTNQTLKKPTLHGGLSTFSGPNTPRILCKMLKVKERGRYISTGVELPSRAFKGHFGEC
jgi:hypothetical protein